MSDRDETDAGGATAASTPSPFGPDDGLTPRQGRAVEALMREASTARAAAAAGVNERTLRRWAKEPAFRAAVLRARRDAFGQAVGLTHRYAPVAVATLVKVMNDPMAAASARVAAAGLLLRVGREGLTLDDLSERVQQLEDQAANPRKVVASRAVEREQPDEDLGPADAGEEDEDEEDDEGGADDQADGDGGGDAEDDAEDAT
ncbi:MAG TPA: hypothetical protein VF796_14480 [Humisphaera sp.]